VARWEFAVPKPGKYEVYAWWWASSERPADVPYTVNHLGGSSVIRVNQRINGQQWNLLGTFAFDGLGSVLVSDAASSGAYIVADAIRLMHIGPMDTPTPTPTLTATPTPTPVPVVADVIIDDNDPRFATSFLQDPWVEYVRAGGQHYGDAHHYNKLVGSGQDVAQWSLTVPEPGWYEVYAWWWAGSERPGDVPYTVNHLSGATEIRVDQRINGGQWNLLGSFAFDGQGSVVVSDKASSGGYVVADAIRLVYASPL
jgi:hypothetical protein